MGDSRNVVSAVQRLRSLHVQTERDVKLRRQLDRLLTVDHDGNQLPVPVRDGHTQETKGIALIEAPGGGKTTAVRYVLEETSVLGFNPETERPRYLKVEVPSPASLKSVGRAILAQLGLSDVRDKTPTADIWDLVRFRLAREGKVVLWIDEAHDLILAKSASETEHTLRMIKSLMQGPGAVIPILSGTERLAEITNFDVQVDRRFTKIMPGDLEFGADEGNVTGLIEDYCDAVSMRLKLPDDLPARLIHASRKRFGRAVETVINAIECALYDGDRTLSLSHFSEAWAMQEGCSPENNVFLAHDWLDIRLDQQADEYESARIQRQRKKLDRG
ncbi:TniB protein [Roseivivax lentus]|uniref:TniB protein n=1 Tax=Roseivivax lentus TaxID=633194 RepID=A0A1N7PY34_9RHOB|nr:TniB family NTP-binding protein [Roseivivax lentus]SIT15524.1 TniB protein [Roseivivax lentus]